jgi:hypothetical protein
MIWIEHYPKSLTRDNSTYDLVEFTVEEMICRNPVWKSFTKQCVEELIGQAIEQLH